MAPRRTPDDDALIRNLPYFAPDEDEAAELSRLPDMTLLPAITREEMDPRDYLQGLIQPFDTAEAPAEVPTLRSAARDRFTAAGLFGDALAGAGTAPAANGAGEYGRREIWRLPARRSASAAILGDDTASSAGQPEAERDAGDAAVDATADPRRAGTSDNTAAPSDPQPQPGPGSPLDHPDARTGLALTAADTLLRKGVDLAINLAGGDRALARRLVETVTDAIAAVVPAEFRASAARSGADAAAAAEQRIDDDERAIRTRAAIGTLAERRAAAEREHAEAMIAGDPARSEEARRDAIEAWRAERRARGDGEAEINAGARELERQHRQAALRHRIAQLDVAGQERFAQEDPDAQADPDAARAAIEESRRIRRADPARAGEASVERAIEARKRDGRIDTPAEEAAARYRLRLDAQAQRGTPEDQRRLLTNDERDALAAEYRGIEASQGKPAADRWLEAEARKAGAHGARFKAEISSPETRVEPTPKKADEAVVQPPRKLTDPSGTTEAPPSPDAGEGKVEPAQDQRRSPLSDTASRKAKAERVLERYQTYRQDNPGASRAARDAAIARIAIEEGELPADVARYFVSRFRQPRDEKDMASFIEDARRIAQLADALPHAIGPGGIPKETLRVARKIVAAADRDPAEAGRNPRRAILEGIRAAGDEAFEQGEGVDPMIPFAVGATIEPTRGRRLAASAARGSYTGRRKTKEELAALRSKAEPLQGNGEGTVLYRPPETRPTVPLEEARRLPKELHLDKDKILSVREFNERFARNGTIKEPWRIGLPQDTAGGTINVPLANGGSVEMKFREYVAALRSGALKPEQIAPVQLYGFGGKIVTADHRRVAAAILAGVEVRYTVAAPDDLLKAIKKKFDSEIFHRIIIRDPD